MAWLALRLVPPVARTSGSAAGRLTSLTGGKAPPVRPLITAHGSPTAPMSPEAAITVTCRAAAASSAALRRSTSVGVSQCSPPVWPAALIEITPPWDVPSRTAATAAAIAFAGLFSDVALTRTTVIAASGATACTISASSTSSPLASHGDAEEAMLVTTCRRAAGRPNRLSKRDMSWRRSLTTGGDSCVSASSGSTTVSPRPSIPRLSSGRMP